MASSYSVNGKVYTDHPLMDEIVYNCKKILSGIVIKNDELANSYETEETIQNAEAYITIKDDQMTLELFPFTINLLLAYGYSYHVAKAIVRDYTNIPEADEDSLLEFACNYFIENYVETNDYYRMLIGLPPYDTDDTYYVYIDKSYVPTSYDKRDDIDYTVPIHLMDSTILAVLDSYGSLDTIIENHKGSKYAYLRFLGDKKIDLYTARKAGKWDILYMPSVEALVEDRFKELYNLNKEVYLKRTYQEAYAFNSDYYEQCMIFMVLCETFNNMIVETPEWYIRRDIFDVRSVEYFLESFGVPFFKKIPLKYQIRIVKNLNKLIKYKSSNRNNEDILNIFALKDTTIYKYYLYKKRLTSTYSKEDDEDNTDNYELEFIQCALGDTYDNYIKDQIYRTPYDDITYEDKYWDGEDEHSYIKEEHLEQDFTITPTKYMSVDYKVSMSDYLFQMQYFLGLILDSNVDTSDIQIGIPSIQSSVYFKLSDLFILLFMLTNGYYDCKSTVRLPNTDTSDKVAKPEFQKYNDYDGGYPVTREDQYDLLYSLNGTYDIDADAFWGLNGDAGNVMYSEIRSIEDIQNDWMKDKFPELFIHKSHLVYGFNMNANLDELSEILSRRHFNMQFNKGYTLADLGIDTFNTTTTLSSIEDLMKVYTVNKNCYDTLLNKMAYDCDGRDEYKLFEYAFNLLFTKPFDYGFYTLSSGETAETLDDILKDRDYILYNTYTTIMSETNVETRQDTIRDIMNDIVNTLEYYLNYDLDYLYSFTTVASFSSLVTYIWLMIDFFKSYKVYFLDPYTTYVSDGRLENSAEGRDKLAEKEVETIKDDKAFSADNINMSIDRTLETEAGHFIDKEVVDIYAYFDPDPSDDLDYNGMYPDSDDTQTSSKDCDGGLVDDSVSIPYIMINGGLAQGSNRDLWDLNGSGPQEMLNYVQVDGGYAEHASDWGKSYMDTAFNYIIDGGSPSMNQFVSPSVHMQIVDNQIQTSVRVSDMEGNTIVETEDGLYIKQSWISWTEFNEFTSEVETMHNKFTYMYDELSETLQIASDEDLLNKKITSLIDEILEPMRTVVTNMKNNAFEKDLKAYIDSKITTLYSDFDDFSPFEWDLF